MNDSASVLGCSVDFPAGGMQGGRAGIALPLDLSQSQLSTEGEGRPSCPPSPAGAPLSLQSKIYDSQDTSYYVQGTNTTSLPQLDELILNPVTVCEPKYLVLQCNCQDHALKIIPQTCMKNTCSCCKDFFSAKRARRVMERIESLRSFTKHSSQLPTLIYTVFTLPPLQRKNYIHPAHVKTLRARIWKFLKLHFNGLWAVEVTHPISEKQPEIFHPHFNFLWQVKPGESSYLDLAVLRRFYYISLFSKRFNMSGTVQDVFARYRNLLADYQPPDVYSRYTNKPSRIRKWVKYIVRSFPQFALWTGPVRYYGDPPPAPERGECLCEKCKGKFLPLGYLSSSKALEYAAYEAHPGLSPPDIKLFDIEFFFDF